MTGIIGVLVLPGVILGILGLRRARVTGAGRGRSLLGIAASVLWAAGLTLAALPAPGLHADPGCARYRAAARPALARVSAALAAGAPPARVRASLSQAVSAVNGATATAQNVLVGNSLATLTTDLQSDLAVAGRPLPPGLGAALASDVASVTRLCGSSG